MRSRKIFFPAFGAFGCRSAAGRSLRDVAVTQAVSATTAAAMAPVMRNPKTGLNESTAAGMVNIISKDW